MKKILTLLVFVILFVGSKNAIAQINFVINPSFEYTRKFYDPYPLFCDTAVNYGHTWNAPLGSPDYFNAFWNDCNDFTRSAGVPKNMYGCAPAVEGNGYFAVGLSGIDTLNEYHSWLWLNYEYVQGKLSQPLVQGKGYCVSFYARLSDSCGLSTWCVGAYLSKDSVPDMHSQWDTLDNYYLHFTPQIQNAEGNFLNDTAWVKIEGSFIADGGEKYITIGNYIPYKRANYLLRNNIDITSKNGSIYYIDMVSASQCEDTIKPEPTPEKSNALYIPNIFSPNSDGANDILYVRGENIKEATISLYNRWGEKVFESNDITKGWDGTYKGKPCPAEVYVYYVNVTFINGVTEQKNGNITLVR
jgi:gliding motility-associated-like protein